MKIAYIPILMISAFLAAVFSAIPIIMPAILAVFYPIAMIRANHFYNYNFLWPSYLGLLIGSSFPILSLVCVLHGLQIDRDIWIGAWLNIVVVAISYPISALCIYLRRRHKDKKTS